MKKMLYAVKITSYLGAYKLWKLLIVKTVHWLCFINCIMMCNVHRLFIQIEHHCMTINTILGAVVREYWGQGGRLPSSTVTWSREAKGKLSEAKRPKTGGGPKPPSPTPVELSILEQLEGRPSLEGICGGIDTADPVETQPSTSSSASSDVPAKKKDVQDSGKKKRKLTILELEERNISLENDKLQEEIEKLKDERQLIVAKKSYYDLKLDSKL